jgi:hypothetical protein
MDRAPHQLVPTLCTCAETKLSGCLHGTHLGLPSSGRIHWCRRPDPKFRAARHALLVLRCMVCSTPQVTFILSKCAQARHRVPNYGASQGQCAAGGHVCTYVRTCVHTCERVDLVLPRALTVDGGHKAGQASDAIATHLRLAPVRVEDAHRVVDRRACSRKCEYDLPRTVESITSQARASILRGRRSLGRREVHQACHTPSPPIPKLRSHNSTACDGLSTGSSWLLLST